MQLIQFLNHDLTRNLTIRYICALRKIHLQNMDVATSADLTTLRDLSSLYSEVGVEARSKAFEAGAQARATAPAGKPIAEPLTGQHVCDYLSVFLVQCSKDDEVIFKLQTFLDYVKERHLEGGRSWSAGDIAAGANEVPRWKQLASGALQTFKTDGKLAYSASRKEWVVL